MKLIKIIMVLMLMLPLVFALDNGYPFFTKFIDNNEQPIEGIKVNLDFGECHTGELITNQYGEIVFVINDNKDIYFKGINQSCANVIQPGDEFKMIIDQSVIGCGIKIIDQKVLYSNTPLGFYQFDSCAVKEAKPTSGGGSSNNVVPIKNKDIIVLPSDEVEEFKQKYLPEPEEPIIVDEFEEEQIIVIKQPKSTNFYENIDANYLFLISIIILLIINLILVRREIKARKND
jgi:hypothetical protein